MKTIDLHDWYPRCPKGSEVAVSDEVAAALVGFARQEVARQVKTFRYRAYYSLDYGDDIARNALRQPETPEEIVLRREDNACLRAAITSLSRKQARRVVAYYLEGMCIQAIARCEGISVSAAHTSIRRGLRQLKVNVPKNAPEGV